MLNSVIRVFVPLIVGGLLSVQFFRYVDEFALTQLVTVVITGLYYLIARILEHYVSGSFGWLLGNPSPPTYLKKSDVTEKEDTSA